MKDGMRSATAAALVLLALASGGASGFIVGRARPAPSALEIPTRHEKIDALALELGLDAEQRHRFEEISDRTNARLHEVNQGVEPAIAAIRSDARAEMRGLLVGKQVERFDAFC